MRNILFVVLVMYPSLGITETELPNPCNFNCGGNDQSSPLNFHVDFETNKWRSVLKPNDKGMGWKPFQIEEEGIGNKFVSITVKNGWNSDYGSRKNPTERSELQTRKFKSFGKEIWYGFKVKVPENFPVIEDRVLITQLKQQTKTRPSPMISIGQRGRLRTYVQLSICGKSGGLGSREVTHPINGKELNLLCGEDWVTGKFEFNPTNEFKELLSTEWSSFVIGSYVTHKSDGFIKIYHNENLIYHYQGPTYGWDGVVSSQVRIGPYRDGNEFGGEYPPQTVHFDDFVIGSDLESVSRTLWN